MLRESENLGLNENVLLIRQLSVAATEHYVTNKCHDSIAVAVRSCYYQNLHSTVQHIQWQIYSCSLRTGRREGPQTLEKYKQGRWNCGIEQRGHCKLIKNKKIVTSCLLLFSNDADLKNSTRSPNIINRNPDIINKTFEQLFFFQFTRCFADHVVYHNIS